LAKSIQAKVTTLTVLAPFQNVDRVPGIAADKEQYRQATAKPAAWHLSVARDAVAAAAVPCELLHLEHDHPYRAIIEAAGDKECDVIVMGSHGRSGVGALLLGSETLKVLTHSTIPVIIYRGQPPATFFAAS
jgi:nucleotide-binding universal stress UspA family protein